MIASPDIESDIFYRSVVLLCGHGALGSFGLIVNKPSSIKLDGDLLEGDRQPLDMRIGGPNQPNQIMLLQGHRGGDDETSLEICSGVYLNGDISAFHDDVEEGSHILFCFGYGGWESGLLEQEYLGGSWFACPASHHYVFDVSPELLWKVLLLQMGGRYRTIALMPEDLDLN